MRPTASQARALLREHWAFAALLLVGALLRVLANVAYVPSIPLRNNDAYAYVNRALTLDPEGVYHPLLYSFLIKPFTYGSALIGVTIVQHLVALGLAVLLYVFVRRLGVPATIGALATAPLLLDGYQIALEHQILTETFFEAFAIGGLVALAWHVRPGLALVAAAGLLLGGAVLIRYAGLALIVAALLYALVRRMGVARIATLVVAFLVPLAAYGLWFWSETGTAGITNRNGFYLYGRVVTFADCSVTDVPEREQVFCPENLEGEPGRGLFRAELPARIRSNPEYNPIAGSFARRMILAMPDRFARAVAADFSRHFRSRAIQDFERWRFPLRLVPSDQRSVPPGIEITFTLRDTPARLLRVWQRTISLYGPLLAALLALGAAGAVAGWAGWSGWRRPPLGPEAALFTLAAIGVLLFPTVFAVYHFRYTIPAIPLAGPAGVLGAWALLSWWRARRGEKEEERPAA